MTSAFVEVERPDVEETMRLDESLRSHLDFAEWVRSAGGSVTISAGLLTIVGPDEKSLPVPEGSVVGWDGESFGLRENEGEEEHGQQRQEQR